MRHVLLNMTYPDPFEYIASSGHKVAIAEAFADRIPADLAGAGIEVKLLAICQALSEGTGCDDVDYYLPPLIEAWQSM